MEGGHFELLGTLIKLSNAIKYLSDWLYRKPSFADQNHTTIIQNVLTVAALFEPMPNIE